MDASQPAFDQLGIRLPADAVVASDSAFSAVQLHDRSRFCWAVVGSPSGAIATAQRGGELLMRLREDEARRLAAALTEAAALASTEH